MKKILCRLFGHRYKVTKRISRSIAELKCKRCSCEFGINTDAQALLPLDNELRELHEELIPNRHIAPPEQPKQP